ncbi:hypothetical protein M2158_010003 [Streptomyces sp. SAI-144]|jgi:hypothetical protein|nr:hypothetical protein [Streptomyces sp. SAI-144]MDH6435920.1 hypothetical protein [Streptomyces sp. SAI-144]MDH6436575.1 hypothetical protein [Streptomyces sp. SAI-144]MDH6441462.1 hypothetical protein [Streptomyces sp. SAI-144]
MSEYPTIDVMTEDMHSASGAPLFFPVPAPPAAPQLSAPGWADGCDPSRGPSEIRLDRRALQAMTEAEMEQQVLEMLMCLRRQSLQDIVNSPIHADGTPEIDSMTAVWVVSTVGKAFDRPLVRLSNVRRESLRSVGGVATLIRQSIPGQLVIGAA